MRAGWWMRGGAERDRRPREGRGSRGLAGGGGWGAGSSLRGGAVARAGWRGGGL